MKLTNDKMILGLDIGIGSVGWALVNPSKERIEDLGVRIFESGEEGASKSSDRASQQARTFRARRRLNRRNKQRKEDLKKYLETIGLISVSDIDHSFKYHMNNNNVVYLRYKGLDEKLSELDIVSILLNMANYRGYLDFYGDVEDSKKNKLDNAIHAIENLMGSGEYRTIGEMFYLSKEFDMNNSLYKSYRNNKEYKYLIERKYLIHELGLILSKQASYYPVLTKDVIEIIVNIIFRQRAFEDGPGPSKEINRQVMLNHSKGQRVYSGFSNMIGKCTYLKEENRGTRNSVIFDVYALINDLSQMTFYDQNGEVVISENKQILKEVLYYLYNHNGVIKLREFEKIIKKCGLDFYDSIKNRKQLGTYKYIKFLTDKNIFNNELIESFIKEIHEWRFIEENCLSHQIGVCITESITPSKRKEDISKLIDNLSDEQMKLLSTAKSSGTANLSTKYMVMAIEAFITGVKYGDFQANFISKMDDSIDYKLVNKGKLLPIKDADLIRNPVVFKSVNETRKIINALLDLYDIYEIHIEVASDVSRSFEQRAKLYKNQLENQESNREIEAELLSKMRNENIKKDITPKMIERFVLWKSQNEKCLYTHKPIPFTSIVNTDNTVQVDHIVAQSIVLDDTLSNKVLVLRNANSTKGNRLPLNCMGESGFVTKQEYISYVNSLTTLNSKKKKYLLLESLEEDIINGFVSRNINDTRYITKYIKNYVEKAFRQMGKDTKVITLKGSVTSRFRQRWLREYTESGILPSDYSFEDKGRGLHYYHHAVDAVIIANLQNKYIALANGYERLRGIEKDKYLDKQKKKDILQREKEDLVAMMEKYYHMPTKYVESLLSKKYVPSICKNLKDQIERMIPLEFAYLPNRSPYVFGKDLMDYKKFKFFHEEIKKAIKNDENYDEYLNDINSLSKNLMYGIVYSNDGTYFDGKDFLKIEKQDIKKLEPKLENYIDNIRMLSQEEYVERLSMTCQDQEFLSRVKMPYISYRIDRKFSNAYLSSDNPVSFKKVQEELGVTSIDELVKYCNSEEGFKCPYYVRYIDEFGNNKKNYVIYEASKYYCSEIYLDKNGVYGMRGIKYVDLHNKNGKLVLQKPLPKEYKHVMYLFKNECISIIKKKREENKMYFTYTSISSVNENRINIKNICSKGDAPRINSTIVKINKHEIDILGKNRGDIRCGDPLSFITEND